MRTFFFQRSGRALGAVIGLMLSGALLPAASTAKADSRYPFRTDFANQDLQWYQLKTGEFPPLHSDHRVSGELVSADFIHRSGTFRMTGTGELVDFTMSPFSYLSYLNAEADLRDIPLGTHFLFFLHQDARGEFTKLATMQEQFTMDASHAYTYRLDEVQPDRLLVTKHSVPKKKSDLGKSEWLVDDQTRVWKGDRQIKLSELVPGDELLYNRTGKMATSPSRCTDIWVGVDTHLSVTQEQRRRYQEFTQARGMPAWIDRVEGNNLIVTLFTGDRAGFKTGLVTKFAAGKSVKIVVANDELRTYTPGVDGVTGKLLEIRKVPLAGYGSSGVQWMVESTKLLEGFRRGRVVRLFAEGWPLHEMPLGEALYVDVDAPEARENEAKESPSQFPYRTDFGNEHLPWFRLASDKLPPLFSEHRVAAELVSVGATGRSGQFRTDRTGEQVRFTVPSLGTIMHRGAPATLSDLPAGSRCWFHLYQDAAGAFTQAMMVMDEFSHLQASKGMYRLEAVMPEQGKLHVLRIIPPVKNPQNQMVQPPPIGRSELLTNDQTRIWKGDRRVSLANLVLGDELLVNLTGQTKVHPGFCTEIWVGAETHQRVMETQRKKIPQTKAVRAGSVR